MKYIGRREELDGKIVKLELEDLEIVLAPDYEKGVVRDQEPWCNINFTADNWLNPCCIGSTVEVNYAIHNAMVCNCNAVHP